MNCIPVTYASMKSLQTLSGLWISSNHMLILTCGCMDRPLLTLLYLKIMWLTTSMISLLQDLLKNSSSHFWMISCLQRSQNYLGSCVTFLKTTCSHVSFTAMRTFTNYLKIHCLLECCPLSLHQKYQKSEIQQSNIYPLIHWFTHP